MDNLMKLKEIRGHRSKAACLSDAIQVSLCETAMAAHKYKAVLDEVRICLEAFTDGEFRDLNKCLIAIKEL